MAEKNFSYESVFRFLRTNLAGFACEEVDELENYVLGTGNQGDIKAGRTVGSAD
mgnify:CR=1 FL=1